MSGSTKAAASESAPVPLPNSQTMYLTRTSPMIRDRKAEVISSTVALYAVCACEGRKTPTRRAHRERGCGEIGVEEDPDTKVDSTGSQACALHGPHVR